MSVLAMAVLAAALFLSAVNSMQSSVSHALSEAKVKDLRVVSAQLEQHVDGVDIRRDDTGNVTRITFDQWPEFATETAPDHAFIDHAAQIIGETATVFAYDPEKNDFIRRTTNIVKPDGKRAVGTPLGSASAAYDPIMNGEAYIGSAIILGKSYQTLYMPIFADAPGVPANANGVAGILYVGVSDEQVDAIVNEMMQTLILYAVVILLIAAVITSVLSRTMLKPIKTVTAQMARVARGEAIDMKVKRRDEIGDLQRGLVSLSEEANSLAGRAQMVVEASQPMLAANRAEGMTVTFANPAADKLFAVLRQSMPNLPQSVTGASIVDLHPDGERFAAILREPSRLPHTETVRFGAESVVFAASKLTNRDGSFAGAQIALTSITQRDRMAQDFETQVSSLLRQVEQSLASLKDRTDMLEHVAHDGTASSSEAAKVAAETAQAIQTVASAVEELNGSFSEVSERISHNASMAREAARITDGAAESAQSLEAAGKRIREVISLIEDVAEQTNLLALNATIEASRAGDAGRGFAVVAAEVKSLAERAATATSEISGEVDRVNQVGTKLLEAVANVQNAIKSVDEVSSSVAAAVTEQQVTTDEISRTVVSVAESAARVQSLSETVTESTGRTGEAADEVSRVTRDLDEVNRNLGVRANQFLESVRKAA